MTSNLFPHYVHEMISNLTKNYCKNKGLLIGSAIAMPKEPEIYRSVNTWEEVPCSNVFCSSCKKQVRWIDGVKLEGNPRALYLLNESEILSYTKQSSTFVYLRTYYCACKKYHTIGGAELVYDERQLSLPPIDVWFCNGHPHK